jgi:hypothetical protein
MSAMNNLVDTVPENRTIFNEDGKQECHLKVSLLEYVLKSMIGQG